MPPYSLRRLLWGGPAATVMAILANLSYYGVTKALGEQYRMPLDADISHLEPMPALMPTMIILIIGLVATILFGILIRFSRKPATVFLSITVAALILSLGGPFNLPSVTMQTKILLSGMNVLGTVILSGGILLISHKPSK